MTGPAPAGAVSWPGGKRAAAAFTFDVDAESAVLFASAGSENRPGVMSHQSYGPLVGVPRLLRLLDKHAVRSTFFVPGYTAERHPGVIRDIVAAGHEIAHHGYMHESLQDVSPETEARWFDRGMEAIERVAAVLFLCAQPVCLDDDLVLARETAAGQAAQALLAGRVEQRGRGDVEAQLAGGGDLVDVLPAGARRADERETYFAGRDLRWRRRVFGDQRTGRRLHP